MAKGSKKTQATKEEAPQVDTNATGTEREDGKEQDTATQLPLTRDGEAGVDYPVSGADPSNVEKMTVKTTGDFSLQDPNTGTDIPMGEKTEVVVTSFIRSRLENGDLEEA